MRTRFSPEQLRKPDIAEADAILRKCVHCGFCTATCPTYLLTGNELDSPRGRIYLVKDMLEGRSPPGPEVARHLDACLTCLSCMTTCPSGVDYNHLLETGRKTLARAPASRPAAARFWRWLLATVVPHPRCLAPALRAGRLLAPLAGVLERLEPLRPGAALLRMAARGAQEGKEMQAARGQGGTDGITFAAHGPQVARMALLEGCAQSVLAARINRASVELLTRAGVEVVIPHRAGCCGALSLHMGHAAAAAEMARANIAAWQVAAVDAVVINASGCGVTVKDYPHLLKGEAEAEAAKAMAARCLDIGECLARLRLPELRAPQGLKVALHAPCTLSHGQKLADVPRALLEAAGFTVEEPQEAHICCGAAGVQSILRPDISDPLGERKARHLEATGADIVASANFACMSHIERFTALPVVHYVELLAWSAGAPRPPALG